MKPGVTAMAVFGRRRVASTSSRATAFFIWTVAACGSQRSNHAAAAVGLGAAVVYTAVHRAATGDCWARCGHGMLCDRRTGRCVEGECAPGCPVGRHCVHELDGRSHCVDETLARSFGRPLTTAGGSPATPLAPDAGACTACGDASSMVQQDGGSDAAPDAPVSRSSPAGGAAAAAIAAASDAGAP
ncbi:MAG: hypothetical protein JW940_21545 [Polyangiaceae bacterium]|nr:hypothetical protein [Polyangiaceae bacterium]